MGGYGSGRRNYRPRKSTVESYLRVDIRYLQSRGCFSLGVSSTSSLTWSRNGKQIAAISYSAESDQIVLYYRHKTEDVQQIITINRTRCHYGGSMVWFLCPGCGRRVISLYAGNRFYCRHCYNLTYTSQNEDYLDRIMRRERKFRERLGDDSGNLTVPIPWKKPKGMWWRTYWRLKEKAERASQGRCLNIVRRLGIF